MPQQSTSNNNRFDKFSHLSSIWWTRVLESDLSVGFQIHETRYVFTRSRDRNHFAQKSWLEEAINPMVHGKQVSWQWVVSFVGAALVVVLCAWFSSTSGFPLDDSWIHQDFARTLVTSAQFAFQPGRNAAGETSPLWALLLTPPYLFTSGHPPLWLIVGWSDALGIIILATLGIVAASSTLFMLKTAGAPDRVQQVGVYLAIVAILSEWHPVWASASGMETMLFALLVLLMLFLAAQKKHPAWIGFWVSIALGVRPEGWLLLVLIATVCAWTAWREHHLLDWLRFWLAPYLVAFLPGALLYVLFNFSLGGSLVPTTFLAKSAEFAVSSDWLPAVLLWLPQVVLLLFLSSPILVLLAVLALFRRIVDEAAAGPRSLLSRLLWGWSIVLLLAYFGRIDPGYHHSRYLLSALPPLLILAAPEFWIRQGYVKIAFLTHRLRSSQRMEVLCDGG